MTRCSASSNPGRRHRILLVEDEPFVREATCNIIRSAGYEVEVAADALEALQLYSAIASSVDLVMTDIVLPGRSGLELCRDLWHTSPGLAVLLTSGYGEMEAPKGSSDTAAYYLAKPYSRASLVAKIEEIFSSRQSCSRSARAG
jgi:two-component system cell cycle sensor histidine kinase/response regulator CckA